MANFGDIPSNVVLAAEQSIRRNAANDAFEAYTPGSVYTFQHSLVEAAGVVNLVNDSASPGNSKYYGTNGSETRGFYDIPSSMVYPGVGIALSTGSAWGTSITDNSTNWNTAHGWGNHALAGYLTSVPIGGSDTHVQYNNSGAFGGSSKFTWNDTTGVLLIDQTLRSLDSTGTGIAGKDLIIRAGNAWNADATSDYGRLYLSSGTPYSTGVMAKTYLGDPTSTILSHELTVEGTASNISLWVRSKGASTILLGDSGAQTGIFGSLLYLLSTTVIVRLDSASTSILSGRHGSSSLPTGKNLAITGGNGYTISGNNDGGHLYMYGGTPYGSGVRGDIYFGDSTAGYLKAKTTETNVVHYNETTGLLSYGVGGTDFTYTNATAMPTALGGFAAGTTFTAATLDELWTGLLYPYQSPAFSAFTMSAQTTPLEVGIAVTGGNRTFTWSTTNSSNINVNSIVIRDMNTSTDLATGLANDGTELVNIGTDITKTTTNDTHIWRISGINTNSVTFTRNYTITWYSPFYYGVGAPALSVAQIQGLTKVIVAKANYTRSFSPSSQVYYYAYPASYGLLTSIKDPSNFETIADWTVHTVNFTNNPPDYNGGTVSYYVYEFNNLTTQTSFNITFTF